MLIFVVFFIQLIMFFILAHLINDKTKSKGLKIDANNSTLKEGLKECETAMSQPKGKGLFGPQIWQTISLDPELRPFMSDKDFCNKINMLNAYVIVLFILYRNFALFT